MIKIFRAQLSGCGYRSQASAGRMRLWGGTTPEPRIQKKSIVGTALAETWGFGSRS